MGQGQRVKETEHDERLCILTWTNEFRVTQSGRLALGQVAPEADIATQMSAPCKTSKRRGSSASSLGGGSTDPFADGKSYSGIDVRAGDAVDGSSVGSSYTAGRGSDLDLHSEAEGGNLSKHSKQTQGTGKAASSSKKLSFADLDSPKHREDHAKPKRRMSKRASFVLAKSSDKVHPDNGEARHHSFRDNASEGGASSASKSTVTAYHRALDLGYSFEERKLSLLRKLLGVVSLCVIGLSIVTVVMSLSSVAAGVRSAETMWQLGARAVAQQGVAYWTNMLQVSAAGYRSRLSYDETNAMLAGNLQQLIDIHDNVTVNMMGSSSSNQKVRQHRGDVATWQLLQVSCD